VKPEKYDETCDVSLALAKYGAGLPWYRLARLQESFGSLRRSAGIVESMREPPKMK
jgi:hypothetical protein